MGAEVLIPLLIAGASTGAQLYNTNRTERKQDNQLASSIRRQGKKQAEADKRVDEEVRNLEQSTAQEERRERLGQYMQTLERGKQTSGFLPNVGGDAFQADSAEAQAGVQAQAASDAGLASRIDAAGMQRQGEAFGFGRLGTDLQRIGRESQGDAYIDELRLRMIRRNPWIDAASQFGMGAAGALMGAGQVKPDLTPTAYGGKAVYRPTGQRYT